MKFNFVPITLEYAREIDEWHYDGKFEDLFMALILHPSKKKAFSDLVNQGIELA